MASGVIIQCSCQCFFETDQMRAAFMGIDGIRVGEDIFQVGIIVFKGDLDIDIILPLAEIYRFVEACSSGIKIFDQVNHSSLRKISFFCVCLLVFKIDFQPFIQKREFSQTL